ncbi:hypothetical protein BA93_03085 [Finegoldia magna ALB8]|uniref:hypothetical protein n=1 Tax=Finegoldia magna TaxID=1260 RepID=UPI000446D11D|nr:hypothetical protein [Finegoldia magna]EXF27886.1 hypothetical protein BA93_03085 [Finegoldia magna ALB8]
MQDLDFVNADKNWKTDLHEYLTYENKKILTLVTLKSQVRLRLARVRFSRVTFAWIFNYFLQMIFLAKSVIHFLRYIEVFSSPFPVIKLAYFFDIFYITHFIPVDIQNQITAFAKNIIRRKFK